jgi:hypothetical protein
VPTIAETYPGFEARSWFGMMVPAGTPEPDVERLPRESRAALPRAEVNRALTGQGAEPGGVATLLPTGMLWLPAPAAAEVSWGDLFPQEGLGMLLSRQGVRGKGDQGGGGIGACQGEEGPGMPLVAREQNVEERFGPLLPALRGGGSDLCHGGVDLLHQRFGIRLLPFENGRQAYVQAEMDLFFAIPGEIAPAIHQMAAEPGGQIPIQSDQHGGSR